jgi:hypothetical protein
MKTNQMKSKLLAGEPALGCSIMVPSPQMVEMVGHAGFDWVLIDLEHGAIDLETAELMIMAAEASGITPIARPKTNQKQDISSVMDRGAMGVQVPHVNNAEDARRAVSAVKFGPGDNRGMAAGTRPDSYGLSKSADEFLKHSNEQTLVCVQLEHAAAIENVDEILKVEGVGGRRRILHRPIRPVPIAGTSGQSQGRIGKKCNRAFTAKNNDCRHGTRHAGLGGQHRHDSWLRRKIHLHASAKACWGSCV